MGASRYNKAIDVITKWKNIFLPPTNFLFIMPPEIITGNSHL
jgi:hypothetical protein